MFGAGLAACCCHESNEKRNVSKREDPAATLQALGGATVILATASSGKSMSTLVGGLAPRGRTAFVGVGGDSVEIAGDL